MRQPRWHDEYAKEDEIWIDYVADLGDGWDSTYTMAKLLAKEKLTIERESQRFLTQGGRIVRPGIENAESWFEPSEGDIEAHLIELPIVIDSGMMFHSILIKQK